MADPGSSPPFPDDADATRLFGANRAAAPVLRPGTVLGNTYVIDTLLGRGGTGEVYRATHVELGSEHAIRLMPARIAEDPRMMRLWREEARQLGRISNDAIVDYQGFFRDEHGLRYLVTEFVHGESLEQVLRRRRLEPQEVLRLRDRLALGLAAVHEVGIVHRDVSPENILLPGGSIERAKLIDFGIAKSPDASRASLPDGKYSCLSPEQVGLFGGEVDLRSDIYSLGLVLAAAAIGFGRHLDMGSSPETMIAARQRVPDLSEVPVSLRAVIAPMLAPRPSDRPPSMRALLGRGGGSPEPPAGAAWSWPRLAWQALAAAAVLVLLAAGALALFRVLAPAPSLDDLRARLAAATAGYRCASVEYALMPDRSVRLSGYAASEEDIGRLRRAVGEIDGIGKLDVEMNVHIWPYCQVVAILQRLLDHPPRVGARLSLAAADGVGHIGEPLMVDARTPSFDGFLYIDYYDREGSVLHLFPNSEDKLAFRPAQNHLVLGRSPFRRCWILGGSTGEQMLTLVATTEPLFADARPEVEPARDYLPVLTQAIDKLPAEARAAAAVLFFRLEPALPFAAGAQGCR